MLAEASDYAIKDDMQLFMPKDNLNLHVEARGTIAIANDEKNMDLIFARIPAVATTNPLVTNIPLARVYDTYAAPIIREVVRSTLADHTIAEVMQNREAINNEILNHLREKLKQTPVTLAQFGLANVQPPEIIVKAQEAAAERQISVQRAEADKLVRMTQAGADLEVAKKQQEVDLTKAQTQALVNAKLGQGVSPAYLAQEQAKVLHEMATHDNKVFILSADTMSNPGALFGVLNHALKGTDTQKPVTDATSDAPAKK